MNRNIVRFACVIFLVLFLILSSFSCQNVPSDKSASGQETVPLTAPVQLELSLSEIPFCGEITELQLLIKSTYDIGYIEPWVQIECIPTRKNYLSYHYARIRSAVVETEEVTINHDGEWKGELVADKVLEFHNSLQFPYPGIWRITAFIMDGEDTIRSNSLKIAVDNDKSGIYGVDKAGWMQDFAPSIATAVNPPVITTLDINTPPKLNEEVGLTWSITANEDFEKVEVWVEFFLVGSFAKKYSGINSNPIFVNGDITWEDSISVAETVSSKATIAFPDEGDWKVLLWTRTPEQTIAYSTIFLNVGESSGRWGWVTRHE